MSDCQTIRSLVARCARSGVLGVVWLLMAGMAAAQGPGGGGGHPGGGGGRPGMPGGGGFGGGRMAPHGFMAVVPTRHIGLQLGLAGRWWDDGTTMKRLKLRNDQQRRMDDIFEANKPTLLTLYGNLQREEARLAALPAGDLQDETKVFAAIDRVSQARVELEKADAHILVQIRQQLDAGQVEQLDREIANSR